MNAEALLLSVVEKGASVVEIGIGERTDLAETLADRGLEVTGVDIDVPTDATTVQMIQDDITAPRAAVYATADLLYARRLPAELQRPALAVATQYAVPLYFTTLGSEWPIVAVEPITTVDGTWYRPVQDDTDLPTPE